jgi:hypothetical protein
MHAAWPCSGKDALKRAGGGRRTSRRWPVGMCPDPVAPATRLTAAATGQLAPTSTMGAADFKPIAVACKRIWIAYLRIVLARKRIAMAGMRIALKAVATTCRRLAMACKWVATAPGLDTPIPPQPPQVLPARSPARVPERRQPSNPVGPTRRGPHPTTRRRWPRWPLRSGATRYERLLECAPLYGVRPTTFARMMIVRGTNAIHEAELRARARDVRDAGAG